MFFIFEKLLCKSRTYFIAHTHTNDTHRPHLFFWISMNIVVWFFWISIQFVFERWPDFFWAQLHFSKNIQKTRVEKQNLEIKIKFWLVNVLFVWCVSFVCVVGVWFVCVCV